MREIEFYIQSEPTNEPVKIKIKVGMRDFSEVKLYIPKVDGKPTVLPNHRWYVYYYFRNPDTGKMEKIKDYCKINTYKTVAERKEVGQVWVDSYTVLLNQGLNPFVKNSLAPKKEVNEFENATYSVKKALQYAYDNKLGSWKKSTADDYRIRLGVFMEWIEKNKLVNKDISELKEVHIVTFMNWLIKPEPKGRGVGGTSQDNYKRCLSGLFGKLVKDKIIPKNIIAEIDTKKDDPIKNTPFTGYEVKAIRDYLLENDKQLYHFIQFVIYTFLRPREIIRLKVSDINLREKYLKVETKSERKKIKKLVGPVLDWLEEININNLPSDAHLFTNLGSYFVWTATEKSKVDHFGNRFAKVKEKLKFNGDYGIYSFRHTAAMDLFHAFMKQGMTEHESILKLMPITGHASETALRNYLRDIGGMLPKDYGEDYTLEF
ncbi:tyrosine-type recombinase/integrase [Flavobacterium commune]|uniref:Tyr recombinase domain-containing protein n=1 Tax=Flavobacterium commune TaxID=1306519 RepID=A0A1D9PAI7_9FLAO|nr:tyrosine-type recombinase/integrase [Flavobacterium commune]AOZ99581.1 hypothetical protein BIW12_09090 [Flavobacterium commune]